MVVMSATITTPIDFHQAEKQFLRLIELTASGEEVVIFKDKQPIVTLSPFNKPKPRQRQFGSAKGLIIMADDFDEPLEDFEEYM
jgi:antitoxin (DNA-binding transcriptional repressor) of toxin-antitoxin stability system